MKPGDQMVITSEMRTVLEAVADRLIPEDAWPSATGAGALDALERRAGEDRAAWADMLAPGLQALEAEAAARHGRAFAALTAGDYRIEAVDEAEIVLVDAK